MSSLMTRFFPVSILLAASVALAIGWMQLKLSEAKSQIAEMQIDLANCLQKNKALTDAIAKQADYVQQLKNQSEAISKKAKEAALKSEEYRLMMEQNKLRLESYSTSGKDECDALREIVDLARNMR